MDYVAEHRSIGRMGGRGRKLTSAPLLTFRRYDVVLESGPEVAVLLKRRHSAPCDLESEQGRDSHLHALSISKQCRCRSRPPFRMHRDSSLRFEYEPAAGQADG